MKKIISLFITGILFGSVTVFAANTFFSDVPSNEWYTEAIANLTKNGLVEGYHDGTFRPNNNITRAEMSAIIDRLMNLMEERGLKDYYISGKFGIKFVKSDIYYHYLEEYNNDLRESENGIGFEQFGDRIKVFYKDENQNIESAILELIDSQGKNSNDCVVERKDENINTQNGQYKIELADKEIIYTEEELARIAEADETSDGGPFNGEWMKKKIYNERLINLCTEYADPAGLATSKTIGSYFEYNDYKAKDRYIFLEESFDPEFYEWNSIEFIIE